MEIMLRQFLLVSYIYLNKLIRNGNGHTFKFKHNPFCLDSYLNKLIRKRNDHSKIVKSLFMVFIGVNIDCLVDNLQH